MKKILSIFMSVVMALSCLTMATSVFADEAKTVKVEFSVYDDGIFTMTPQVINVSENIDDAYAEQIGFNDKDGGVTVFDAVIAAHIALFGDEFMTYVPIEYSNSMLKRSFGESTTALGYRINGAIDDGTGNYYNLESTLNDGDSVEYMFYQDKSFYGDKYTRFDKRNATLMQGDSLTLTLSVETYDADWNTVVIPFEGAKVTVNGENKAVTDENGKATLTFDELGTFGISAEGQYSDDYDDYEIFAPYCTVTVSNQLTNYIDEQQKGAFDFIKSKSYTINNTVDFIIAERSGCDVSAYKEAYANSVKDNLDANGGKIILGSEDLGVYGAVITLLNELGYNPYNFYGYDICEAFEAADIASARPQNPYFYKYAIEAASDTRAAAIIDDFIANYYTLGRGMNYYGYSCDNTATFLISIAPYAGDYAEYVSDAKALVAACVTEKGAYYSEQYNTPNADSTAVAMAAFAAVGDLDAAFNCYKILTEEYQSENTGVMLYGGEENALATKDALFGFYYAENLFVEQSFEHPTDVCKTIPAVEATCTKTGLTEGAVCVICGNVAKAQTEVDVKEHTIVNDAAVPATFTAAGKTAGSHCSVCNTVIVEQKDVAKLVSPKLNKLKKGKKKFTATWTKAAGVDGYQVQYSLKKNFKKAKKKNIKSNKNKLTVKKLKSKKTYYVRVRAYKKINGKNVYSAWSTKKVKVK